jgi:hypothetical protein
MRVAHQADAILIILVGSMRSPHQRALLPRPPEPGWLR